MTPLHTQMLEEAEAELDVALERTRRAMRRIAAYGAVAPSSISWDKAERMADGLSVAEGQMAIELQAVTVLLAQERAMASTGPVTP